jgi:hypothetical protein
LTPVTLPPAPRSASNESPRASPNLHTPVPTRDSQAAFRTQFFGTLRDQTTHFTGQDRSEKTARAYEAMTLLPFTEAQTWPFRVPMPTR